MKSALIIVGTRAIERIHNVINQAQIWSAKLDDLLHFGTPVLSEAEAFRMGCRPGPKPPGSTDPRAVTS
jgi:hypothetical protein